MSRSNDRDDRAAAPRAPEDALLVDLLYGELEGDEADCARRRVEADEELAGELGALRRVRELFGELPDEEPPAAMTAQLLHAAAREGPTRRAAAAGAPPRGFWAALRRLLSPIMLHPAMAAAASLILVAGIAGALVVRGKHQVSEPRTESAAPAPGHADRGSSDETSSPAAAADPWKQPPVAPRGGSDGAEWSGRYDTTTATEAADDSSAERPRPAERPRRATAAPPKEPKKDQPESALLPSFSGGAGAPAGNTGKASSGKPAPPPPPASAPPPRQERGPAPTSGDSVPVDTVEPTLREQRPRDDRPPAPEESEDSGAEARRLHRAAVAAAGRGDCKAAIELGTRIRRLDPGYFDTVYLRDERLASCYPRPPAASADSP